MKNNLRELRMQAGLSTQDLAAALGKNHTQQICQLEKAGVNPTLRTAYEIAAVLGVYVTDIWPNDVKTEEVTVSVPKRVRRIKRAAK